ncbi:unnamed protein product [Diplocarpon coronariae]
MRSDSSEKLWPNTSDLRIQRLDSNKGLLTRTTALKEDAPNTPSSLRHQTPEPTTPRYASHIAVWPSPSEQTSEKALTR